MSVESTQSTSTETEQSTKALVRTHLREHSNACLVLTETVSGEQPQTVFTALPGTDDFVKVLPAGNAKRVRDFKMSQGIERIGEDNAEILASQELDIDIEAKVESVRETLGTEDTRATGGYGAPKEHLDENEDDVLESAAGPIGTSDVHGGGW
jgi:hypothetical protein